MLFSVTKLVIVCYGSSRKIIQAWTGHLLKRLVLGLLLPRGAGVISKSLPLCPSVGHVIFICPEFGKGKMFSPTAEHRSPWRFLRKSENRTIITSSSPTSEGNTITVSKRDLHPCSLQHYLQEQRHGNNLNVHRQMNGRRKCGIEIEIEWSITHP